MNRIKSAAIALYLAIAASGLAAAPAQAAVIYSYTGNVFFSFLPDEPSVPWSTSDRVTGSFMVDTAIEASATFIDATSRAGFGFSFTDGVNSYMDSSTGIVVNNFRISTGPTGDITAWTIDLKLGSEGLITRKDQNFVNDIASANNLNQVGGNQNSSGSWSVSQIPEPATLALLGLGLVGLGLARRRKAA